jgi:hypothetical protein
MRKFKPNYIWIGSPKLIDFIPKKYHDRIVYDCMDDYFAFSNNSSVLNREKKVAELAKLIFVSSESLQNKLINRYNADVNKIKIVRNAFNGKLIKKDEKTLQNGKFHICYIGTISEWFDFSLMKKISETFENVQFELIGPVDLKMKNPYVNEHIVYHGPIKHDELYSRIKDYDCLIMPFKVNEVVESVDPVKLYEYINFEKNIICVYYDEIKRFEPYVHFYHNQDEAIDIVKNLLIDNKCKYSLEDKKKFLIDNTWTSRCNEIFNYIENDDSRQRNV